jgi:S1-C subfamily serine protease
VNGEDLTHTSDLADLISEFTPGEKVKLGVLRDGEMRTIEVELGERPGRLDG